MLLLISFGYKDSFAKANDSPAVDTAFKERLEILKKEEREALNQTYICDITWNIHTLEPEDRHSPSKPYDVTYRFDDKEIVMDRFSAPPHGITFFYDNKEIMRLIDSRGEWPSQKGHGIQCIKFNNFVYIFWDTLTYGDHWKFHLNPESYVIYSSDNGVTWSKLQPLSQLSRESIFVLPKREFFRYLKILGDEKGHFMVINNLRDQNNYVFDAHLNLLEKITFAHQVLDLDHPLTEFQFYNGKVYLIRRDCGNKENDGSNCIDVSDDYGQNWTRSPMPYTTSTRFITHNGSLYHFYIEPCPSSLNDFIPALGDEYTCGRLKVSKLDDNNRWGQPKTLLKTAGALRDVYSQKNLIIAWQDFRFAKPRVCGFIPIIGCIDSGPFDIPWAVYAGEFEPESMTLKKEILIEYGSKWQSNKK